MTKYSPMGHRLAAVGLQKMVVTFAEIESWLGFQLPRSARVYPAWWANEQSGTHSHAKGWMNARYETRDLDLSAGRVTFVRR
jgi:hypothetical protein